MLRIHSFPGLEVYMLSTPVHIRHGSLYGLTRLKPPFSNDRPPLIATHLLMMIPLQPQPVPNRILSPHDCQRQSAADTREHKRCPFPPERVDRNAEHEPVHQLRVSEEVEGTGGRTLLDERGHVDPSFHPFLLRRGERVDEEHEQQAGVDSNVVLEVGGISQCDLLSFLPFFGGSLGSARGKDRFRDTYITYCSDGIHVCTVVGLRTSGQQGFEDRLGMMLTTDRHMLGWEDFGGFLSAYISITSHVRIYLGGTSWVVHKAFRKLRSARKPGWVGRSQLP